MKKNLIKILTFLLLSSLELLASSYEWSVSSSKRQAFLNEAIYLSYVCTFSDKAEFYAVEFDPLKSDENSTIVMLSETSKLEDGKKILQYEFVAFARRAGEFVFDFDAIMKKTTKDSVESTVIGRDNRKYAEYQTKKVKLQSVSVEILDANASLVGEFSLKIKKDAPSLKALTPYHFEVIIEGNGNFEALKAFNFSIEGVKVFSEEPKRKLTLTPEGYKGSWSQKFAFVAQRDFTLPAFALEYFSPKARERKMLKFEGAEVKVSEGYKRESLLDEKPEPKEWWRLEYLYFILSFVAGFLVAKIKFFTRVGKAQTPLCEKLKNAASLEAFSILLILEDALKYEAIVKQIESKEITSLSKAKRLICR